MFIEKKIIPRLKSDGSISKFKKTIYILQCDQCHAQYTVDRALRANMPHHFCSSKCRGHSLSHGILKSIREQTTIDRFGTPHAMQNPIIAGKAKKTNVDRYGCENPMLNVVVKQKSTNTLLKLYGVDNPLKCEEIRNRQQHTMQERYGVDNISKLPQIKEQKAKTLMDNYGITSTFLLPGIKEKLDRQRIAILEKVKQTNLQRYGVENVFSSPVIQEQIKQTNMERYGVDNPSKNTKVQQKIIEVMLQRYGVENIMLLPHTVSQIKETCMTRYGVEHVMCLSDIIAKIRDTCIERYGVPSPMQSKMIKSKIDYQANAIKSHETKKKNGTYGKSKEEDRVYDILVKYINPENIIRQFRVHRWSIDFYIPLLNVFINYNGSYYHGLDRSIETIQASSKKIDQVIYQTYLRDQQRIKYFQENNMKLIVLTDKELYTLSEEELIFKIIA